MEISTTFQTINWLAVLIATVSAFFIGGIWYGPVFGNAWMKEMNLTEEDLGKRNLPKVFGGAILLILVATINLAMFLGPEADIAFGGLAGFFAGFGWVSTFIGTIYLFGDKSLKLFFIDAGYCTITLTSIGLILGAL